MWVWVAGAGGWEDASLRAIAYLRARARVCECECVRACVRVCDEMRASVGLCKRLGSLRDGAS